VGLSGYGGLRDWEIFNRPNYGGNLPFTFPLIYAKEQGQAPVCRVAQGPVPPPHVGGGGGDPCLNGEGFPHLDACVFRGEYPLAWIDFTARKLPVKLQLEAYNPFIPSHPDDSGFPAAVLTYTVTNRTAHPVDATLAWSLFNAIGSIGVADQDRVLAARIESGLGRNVNTCVERDGLRGLLFSSEKWGVEHPRFGTMALATPEKNVTVMRYWSREPWFTPKHELWDTFSATGRLPEHDYDPSPDGQGAAGALGVRLRLAPHAVKTVRFYITWHFPNFEKYWHQSGDCGCDGGCKPAYPVWKNYYASQFSDAWAVAAKLHAREPHLRAATRKFHDALFASTLPAPVLDAVSSQMSILKTATCIRLPDGTFYGFEGCAPGSGCCEGSCTHVWNYQQSLAFLFPSLERSMRSADYHHNLRPDGGMGFRLNLPLGSPPNDFLACADGQMGGIIKTYRDWKISGDDAWLRKLWPRVRQALEYAWKNWDPEKRGVMTGIQHNTYDIEFHGPNPMMAGFYLGALLAASEMADHLGEPEKALEYRAVFEQGRAWTEAQLFNGEYYVQQYDPKQAPRYQFGAGCLSDQMLGQWLTSIAGLGYVFTPARVRKTLRSIVRHNWRRDLREHANAQRVYALNGESGLLLCSWPRGGRPAVPFPYSDEVWTGIEYQVASHCIMEGLVKEGLAIVQGARERHDGIKRNPWNEFECGHHYARAMSSYGLLTALSGFQYHQGLGVLGFAPRIQPEAFRCFWALDGVWGTFEQRGRKVVIEALDGELLLNRLDLPALAGRASAKVSLGGKTMRAPVDEFGSITLPRLIRLVTGKPLTVTA
jgi:uncharacterized protein (DUF608 family)